MLPGFFTENRLSCQYCEKVIISATMPAQTTVCGSKRFTVHLEVVSPRL